MAYITVNHEAMYRKRPYFLLQEISALQLSAWSEMLPEPIHILGANLFADVFLMDATGAVHILEISVGTISKIALSEEEFDRRCVDDEDGWLLRQLVDQCHSAGLICMTTQCYAFTQLPLFGGEYELRNIWACDVGEWINFMGDIYAQTKDLPEGATVSLKVIE